MIGAHYFPIGMDLGLVEPAWLWYEIEKGLRAVYLGPDLLHYQNQMQTHVSSMGTSSSVFHFLYSAEWLFWPPLVWQPLPNFNLLA